MSAFGRLYGVGIGPGDPDLLTVKATKVIAASPVVAYFAKAGRRGNARLIVDCWLTAAAVELPLYYPMTDETQFDDPPYRDALARFYEESHGRDCGASRRWPRRRASERGRSAALRLVHASVRAAARQFRCEHRAGRLRHCGAWGVAGAPMTWGDDVLVVLPATLPLDELRRRLALADAAVIMKLGRNFARAKEALIATGMAERAIYVERGTMAGEVVTPLCQKQDDSAPYFSLILRPGGGGARERARYDCRPGPGPGRMDDAGGERGDGGRERRRRLWPLCGAARIAAGPARSRQRQPGRNGARPACAAARRGRPRGRRRLGRRSRRVRDGGGGVRGDRSGPAMAEARHCSVVPGVTAMQAAAARLGAPLGHDFCAISLSDNLKPWAIVERRLRAAAEGDFVIALYNPASRARPKRITKRSTCCALRRRRRRPSPSPARSGAPTRSSL